MTAKELRRLGRTDLMEMLLELSKENVQLRQQLDEANRRLEEKELRVERTGSLAEAALQLSGVFEAAQAACEQYEYNVRLRCKQLEEQTNRECNARLAAAPVEQRGKRRGKKK